MLQRSDLVIGEMIVPDEILQLVQGGIQIHTVPEKQPASVSL